MEFSMFFSDLKHELINIEQYITLSAEINYHLSAVNPDLNALLALILGPNRFDDQRPLLKTLQLLILGYGLKRRKMGPFAVIHPFRTAALLSRSRKEPTIIDILGALLHDKNEDLTSNKITKEVNGKFVLEFNSLLESLPDDKEWFLQERLELLTRLKGQTYLEYLVKIFDSSLKMPDLLHIILADRLDNTLDTHIQRPGVLQLDFFQVVFDLLFLPDYDGIKIRGYHFLPPPKDGVLLLSQLFKNIIFLSLMRSEKRVNLNQTSEKLFNAIVIASIRESQWLALELFIEYQGKSEVKELRKMLLATMEYCSNSGASEIRKANREQCVDGIFLNNYPLGDVSERKSSLKVLYSDHKKLIHTLVSFISTFASFLHDPEFSVQGIDRSGIKPIS
jgi:hypothetical protein